MLLDLIAALAVILSLEQNLLDALTVVEMINFNPSQAPPDHLARVQAAFRKHNIKAEQEKIRATKERAQKIAQERQEKLAATAASRCSLVRLSTCKPLVHSKAKGRPQDARLSRQSSGCREGDTK